MAETVPRLRRTRDARRAPASSGQAPGSERPPRRPDLTLALGLLALAAFVSPLTRTWFLGDDAFTAFLADAVAQRGDSPFGFMANEVQRAAEQLGRSSPLSTFVVYTAYLITPSVFAFKLAVVAVTLLSAALGVILLSQLGVPRSYAVLVPVSLCALLQFRYWHDPLLAYAALMPTIACLVLGSLIALSAAVRRGSLALHVLAVALFVAGYLYWEGTVFLTPVVLAVAWCADDAPFRTVIRRTAPFVVVATAFVAVILGLRAAAPAEGPYVSLYQPSLSPGDVATAVAKQVSGSAPLSYFLAVAREPDPEATAPGNLASPYGAAQAGQDVVPGFVGSESALVLDAIRRPRTLVVLVFVALALAVPLASARRTTAPIRGAVAGVAVGAWLVVGQAIGPAVSARWQREVFYGVPYISAYLGYVGIALIAVSALALALRALHGRRALATAVAVVWAAAIAGSAAVTYALNERVIEAFEGVKTAMVFNERALGAGLLRAPGPAKELVLDQSVPLTPEFLSVKSGTPAPPTVSLVEFDQFFADCTAQANNCPRITVPIAYLSRLDARGMPWAAVCRLGVRATRHARAAVCSGSMAVAVGTDPSRRRGCSQLLVDAVPAGEASAMSDPLRLTRIGSVRGVRFCLAQFDAPVLARSITVGPLRSAAEEPLRVVTTHPAVVEAGVPFNVQPNGQSAIAVEAVGVTPTTRVVMAGRDVPSQYIDERVITALVPERLVRRPGRVAIRLRDRGLTSNRVYLEVRR